MGKRFVLSGLLVVGMTGCAGMSPTQVGQTAGSIAGAAIAPGIGMPLGALLGTLTGLVFEQHVDQVREKRERVELGDQLQRPSLSTSTAPAEPAVGQPTRVWVDERVEHGRLIAGHFEVRPVP
ncbi:MAG: hypothetical protein HY595_02400 [Candidatus Omnitrophica bacterium]|nr:hypothetical protein [Candidatus Omnitrophota bacterium]